LRRRIGRKDPREDEDDAQIVFRGCTAIGRLQATSSNEAACAGRTGPVSPNSSLAARREAAHSSAVAGLSVPFRPRGSAKPTSVMPQTDEAQFYQLYFQAPGVAEAEFERDPRATIRRMLGSVSFAAPRETDGKPSDGAVGMVPRSGGVLTQLADPERLPSWLTDEDVNFYAAEFARTGFRGLNYYRNIDRNWELMAPFAGLPVTVPALYVAGDRDLVVRFRGAPELIANLTKFLPNLRKTIMLPGCGHWTQQERPAEVNAALLEFLRGA
jgi:epoxide hydrolase A/B